MKRVVCAFLALVVSTTLVFVATSSKHSVKSVHAQGGCSVATLTGNYAFSAPGFSTVSKSVKGNEVPIAAVGVFALDGAGNVSTSYTLAFRGIITPGLTGTGTYTVNSDCTGSISFTGGDAAGLNFNMVIIGGGAEIFGILASPTSTVTFDSKKQ